jgi:hypothetical protein
MSFSSAVLYSLLMDYIPSTRAWFDCHARWAATSAPATTMNASLMLCGTGMGCRCVKGEEPRRQDRYDTGLDFSTNRLLKNSLGTPEWSLASPSGKTGVRTQGAQTGQTSHPPTPARRDAPFREQGRSERRSTEVQTALRVGRSPQEWILANGKVPPALPTSENLIRHVEPLSARERCMGNDAPRRAWAGGRATFAASC